MKATKKASVLVEAPNILAKIISLIKPEILEINVMLPTIYDDFKMELFLYLVSWFVIHNL